MGYIHSRTWSIAAPDMTSDNISCATTARLVY